MANLDAQIIKLARSTRAQFETDSSGVTDSALLPLMCVITGEAVFTLGFKTGSSTYQYITDDTGSLAALVAAVEANEASITALQATVNNLASSIGNLQGPFCFGQMSPPYGEVFTYGEETGNEARRPLMAVDFSLGMGFSDITWLKIATNKMFAGDEPGKLYIRLEVNVGDAIVRIYPSDEDAQNETNMLAEGIMGEDTPGLMTIYDADDFETVFGWLYTEGGISDPSGIIINLSVREGNAFGLPASRIVPGARVRIPFKFYLGGFWSSTGADAFNVYIGSVSGFVPEITTFSFDTRDHGYEEGFVFGEVVLEVISTDGIETKVRCSLGFDVGDPALSQLIDYQPRVQEGAMFGDVDGNVVLDLSVYNNSDGTAGAQFDLHSLQAFYEPPAGDLT